MDKPTITQPPALVPLRSQPDTFAERFEDHLIWQQANGFPGLQNGMDYLEFVLSADGLEQAQASASDALRAAQDAGAFADDSEESAALALSRSNSATAAALAAGAPLFADTDTMEDETNDGDLGVIAEGGGSRIYLNVGGTATPQEWLVAPSFDYRADLVTWVADPDNTPTDGWVYRAGGLFYIGETGSTAISTLPGLKPLNKVYAGHFGTSANMTYEQQALLNDSGVASGDFGWVRLTGTDDRAAIVEADAYAASVGKPLWFEDGGYYYEDEIQPTTRWLSESDFGAVLWPNYGKVDDIAQSGLAIFTDGAGLGVPGNHGFKIIGQFSSDTLKIDAQGHLGTIWRTNNYYSDTEQPILNDIHVRALTCRAATQRDGTGSVIQRSISSIMGAAMGGVENFSYELGVFGKTNVASSHLILAHWACRADLTGLDPTVDDLSQATIEESYHSIGGSIKFLTRLDNADGHQFKQPYEIASGGDIHVGAFHSSGISGGSSSLGGGCGAVTSGDVVDNYAVASQAGRIGCGITIDTGYADEVEPAAGTEQFYARGYGTGKATTDVEAGTAVQKQRQQRKMQIKCAGFVIRTKAGEDRDNGRAIYLEGVEGEIDLGVVDAQGWERSIESEHCYGSITGSLYGDGAAVNNFSDGFNVNVYTDLGDEANAADTGNYAAGYESPNSRAVEIAGSETSFPAVSGALSKGATSITLASATTRQAFIGDLLEFSSGQRATVSDLAATGALTISIDPISFDVPDADTVSLIQRARNIGADYGFQSSYNGIVLTKHAELVDADISKVKCTGAHAILAGNNAAVILNKGSLPFVGRSSGALSTRRTIKMEDQSRLIMRGVHAGDNSTGVQTHVQLLDNATALISGCEILDNGGFLSSSNTAVGAVSWDGNTDGTGVAVQSKLLANTWTPEISIGGSQTGITYDVQTGSFSVIGNILFFSFNFRLTSKGVQTGTLELDVTDLPYDQQGDNQISLSITPASVATTNLFITADDNTFTMQRQATSGQSSLDESDIADNSRFRGNGWFYIQ